MFVVVGLGNPGVIYENSRHNVGWHALDALAAKLGIEIRKHAHRALIGEGMADGKKVMLVKPQTYMNLSGESVQSIMAYYKLAPEELIVIYDDIDLPVGELRIRPSGSAGTHNGMRSIIACLGEDGFNRIRVGIGRQQDGRDLVAHVLGKPDEEDQKHLDEAYTASADAALMIIAGKLSDAQAKYNKKAKKRQVAPEPKEE